MVNAEYLYKDPENLAVKPDQQTIVINSGGYRLFARVFKPTLNSPEEKRPAALILHGFPGNEKFRDLAQGLRRCGFVAVAGGFRGCWGCEGYYRFSTLLDDAKANLEYLREHADELNIDTDRIYVIGHSMGGFTTLRMLGANLPFKGAVLIAPCNLYGYTKYDEENFNTLCFHAIPFLRMEDGGVSTCERGTELLKKDCELHAEEWPFEKLAAGTDLSRPMLFIGGTVDTSCPPETHMDVAVKALEALGGKPDTKIYPSDHSFQDVRIEFTNYIASWLCKQEQ